MTSGDQNHHQSVNNDGETFGSIALKNDLLFRKRSKHHMLMMSAVNATETQAKTYIKQLYETNCKCFIEMVIY